MRNKVIILYPFKFRYFDYQRFEINHLNKKNDVIVFEFIQLFYKHFEKAYVSEKKKIPNLKKIFSLKQFYLTFEKLTEHKGKNVILNFINNDTLNGLLINSYINKKNLKIINFYNPGVSTFNNSYSNLETNIFNKFLLLYQRKNETIQKIKERILNLISNFIKVKNKYYLVAGTKCLRELKKKNINKNLTFIKGSSWDYSKRFIHTKNKLKKNNFCVYLDAPGPKFLSDSHLYGEKFPETSNYTYPSLRRFFDDIEKKKKINVVIAPHPKTSIKSRDPLFGKREVISNRTHDLIMKSDLVLTRNSTAIIFAIIYKKPIILFYTNQTINKETYWNSKNISQQLSCELININRYKEKNILKIKSVNKKKYQKYIYNFCSFKNVRKPNYKIIEDFISDKC